MDLRGFPQKRRALTNYANEPPVGESRAVSLRRVEDKLVRLASGLHPSAGTHRMLIRLTAVLAMSLTLTLPLRPAQAAPIETMRELPSAFVPCWSPPSGSGGLEATVRFSLKRSGHLLGEPRISYSRLGTDEDLNRAFTASVLKSLEDCTPVEFSDSFGGAIAGRVLSLRFHGR